MSRPRWYDWLGGLALWSGATFAATVLLMEGGVPDETALSFFFASWAAGVVGARIWWLRRGAAGDPDRAPGGGLTTGEMTAQRLELMEQRIYELEERLDLTERLLAQSEARGRLPQVREDAPA